MHHILFILLGIYSVLAIKSEIKLISDVIDSYDMPAAVIAKLCWEKSEQVSLAVELGTSYNPKAISFAYSRTHQKQFKADIQHIVFYIVDVSCPDTRKFLKAASHSKTFRSPYRWLLIGQRKNSTEETIKIEDLDILSDSEVIVSQENDEFTELFMVYKRKSDGELLREHFGKWTLHDGITKVFESVSIIRRKDFGKDYLKTTLTMADIRTKNELCDISNPVDSATKCGFRLINILADFLNATNVNVFSDTWGYYINGSWNGMIGKLIHGEVEIASTPMYMTKERIEVVYYLTNDMKTRPTFVFREPPLSYQNNLFLLPFRRTVWYTFAGFAIILLLLLYLNARWEMKQSENEQEAKQIGISDVALMFISAVSQQGTSVELKRTTGGRMVILVMFVACLFLYTSYSACIVALLQSTSNQIRTLSDLLNSKIELGSQDTPYNRHYFMAAKDPVRKAIYEVKLAPKGSKSKFMQLEEGVRKMQTSAFAFHLETGAGYKVVNQLFQEHEKCGLQEIPFLQLLTPWLVCNKNSAHRKLFRIGMYRLREHGLTDRVNRLMFARKPLCSARGGSFDSVNIVDVYPAFLMLLYGMILAFTFLLLEVYVHRYIK